VAKRRTSKAPVKKPSVTRTSVQKNIVQLPVKVQSPVQSNNEFAKLVGESNVFDKVIGKFPTKNNRIAEIAGNNLAMQQKIVEHAKSAYPLIHDEVQSFITQFLHYKKSNGTNVEKALYKDMSVQQFTLRLLAQRPLMFMTGSDQYLLAGKLQGQGGFEKIGTDLERAPLILKDYLSYDEMVVAALVGITVPTYFINNGARDNKGSKGPEGSYEKEGVYAGLVGARFEKPGYMEWQHMIITQQQTTAERGYGLNATHPGLLALWSNLYGEKFPTFTEARKDNSGKYVPLSHGSYFNKDVYKKRIRFVAEPFLVDAHKRAAAQNKKAYVHVVGLGLGEWKIDERQAQYMLDVYADIIHDNNLSSISDIDFSWFFTSAQKIAGVVDGGKLKNITVHFSERNPADKLIGNDAGKLLVAMYAWDGNAYPGNEYWAGMLTASGDPAAACCSTIAELQNPKVNPFIKENIKKLSFKNFPKKQLNANAKNVTSVSQQLSWWGKIKLSVQSKMNYLKQRLWKKG
jgi:hypothetical protein